MDGAVAYTALARSLPAIAGPINLWFVLSALSPEEQGFYYSFASVLAFLGVLELGFGGLLVHFASHEGARLHLQKGGRLAGPADSLSRLQSLTRKACRFYAVISLGGVLALWAAGFWFLDFGPSWLLMSAAAAGAVCAIPLVSIPEGAGQVLSVARMRFWQAAAAIATLWLLFALGFRLWAPAGSALASFLVVAGWCLVVKRRLTRQLLLEQPMGQPISWRRELLPVQWRTAITSLSAYLANQSSVPLVLRFQGPVPAGQFGMALNLSGACLALGSSWITPRWTQFGALVARESFADLDNLFVRSLKQSVSVLFLLGIGVLGFAELLRSASPAWGARILPGSLLTVVLVQMLALHTISHLSAYCRAHKEEPFLIVRILHGLGVVACTLVFGRRWGIEGVVWANTSLALLALLPAAWITWRRRGVWQQARFAIPTPA